MLNMRIKLSASALLLAVLVASCDSAPPADRITAPEGVLTSAVPSLVHAQPPAWGLTRGSDSGLIGPAGGTITAGGHSLTVPAGAANANTTFTLTVLDDDYVEVSLSAINGGVNVGASGFANGKTVTLTLSYAEAKDVSDPSKLVIVRRLDGGDQVLPVTLNTANKTVMVQLGHFSRYAMATW
jgi:hypothetical protein